MQQESGLRVSHEAIYAAIYALPRGELRRELIGCLRHAKPARGRKPKGSELRGKLVGMTNIKDRPEEIEGRLVLMPRRDRSFPKPSRWGDMPVYLIFFWLTPPRRLRIPKSATKQAP